MNRKQIVRKLKATNKLTFMCTFCFSYLQVTKNHFCNEALEIDGVIHNCPAERQGIQRGLKKWQRFPLH